MESNATHPTTGRAMIVEDDDMVRNMCVRILQRQCRFETDGFAHPQRALDKIRHYGTNFHYSIVLTDNRMPNVNDGLRLAGEIYRINPDLPVILLTGTRNDLDGQQLPPNIKYVADKPIHTHELAQIVTLFALER